MRYLPEWILSTPRLILVILTIGLIVFTYGWITEPTVFKDIALVVFWYFFGSRGSEPTAGGPKANTVTITDTTDSQESINNLKKNVELSQAPDNKSNEPESKNSKEDKPFIE